MFQPFTMFPQQILLKVNYNNTLNETSKPPVNKKMSEEHQYQKFSMFFDDENCPMSNRHSLFFLMS